MTETNMVVCPGCQDTIPDEIWDLHVQSHEALGSTNSNLPLVLFLVFCVAVGLLAGAFVVSLT